eukprot:TRINITY_DN23926_c0_g1_i1.p1 TRINITY_DN23926_c0_g1~~TRINITY_DN23926_c0_g1_i1.p1  ORF type:complete len:1505 (-),score=212.22 TRINITY_DN23926_c0_g1_i1:112-4530(-)
MALLQRGKCEEIGCSPIVERDHCEAAAKTFGLDAATVQTASAKLLLSTRYPSFCVWARQRDPRGKHVGEGRLWLNALHTSAEARSDLQQLCHCDRPPTAWSYSWSIGEWGACDFDCAHQRRERIVTCLRTRMQLKEPSTHFSEVVQTDRRRCLELGLSEPTASEPCRTEACFGSQLDTRCAGEDRHLSELEATAIGHLAPDSDHCVIVDAGDANLVVNVCRLGCVSFGDCVGFTFYSDAAFSGKIVGDMCCFLRKATRWVTNFRHAACNLLQGIPTLHGCYCQVGWVRQAASSSPSSTLPRETICGPASGGCCRTSGSGAVSWCPTTSPTCGAHPQGQQRWDVCDQDGLAVVTEGTCEERRHSSEQGCASVQEPQRCRELAVELALPSREPILELSLRMPSACVWQKATSQLWFNELITAVTATQSIQQHAPPASQEYAELCTCSPMGYGWEADSWSPCFKDPQSPCGSWSRTRRVWCTQRSLYAAKVINEIADDSLCISPKPVTAEPCSACTDDVASARASFQASTADFNTRDKRDAFVDLCRSELAHAMGDDSIQKRLQVLFVECCSMGVVVLDIWLAGNLSQQPSELVGDTLESLITLLSSKSARSDFEWLPSFRPYALTASVEMLGIYSWEIASDWGPCNATCGGGVQTRDVRCVLQTGASIPQAASESVCNFATRPPRQRACASRSCRSCPAFKLGPEYDTVQHGNKVHGSFVYVTCAPGYSTDDDVVLARSHCADGKWTTPEVSCGTDCGDFEIDSGRYVVTGSGSRHGATRQVTCSGQSPPALESPPSSTVVCDNGAWTALELLCTGDCAEVDLSSRYAVFDESGHPVAFGGGHAPHRAARRVKCAPGYSVRDVNASEGGSGEVVEVTLWCNDGSWQGQEGLPMCRADCPPFVLRSGYELISAGGQASVARQVVLPSGGSVAVRCSDAEVRVPGAMATLRCFDGEWTRLDLVCERDCSPLNMSQPEMKRYSVVNDGVRAEHPSFVTDNRRGVPASGISDSAHTGPFNPGSALTIRCRGSVRGVGEGGPQDPPSMAIATGVRDERMEKLVCENGEWSQPTLRCYDACPPLNAGPAYEAMLVGHRDLEVNATPAADGAIAFVTCAEGFSPVGGSHVTTIDRVTCVDGFWTSQQLHCVADCPDLSLGSAFTISGNGGNRVNATRRVTCSSPDAIDAASPSLHLECSEFGVWLHVHGSGNRRVGPGSIDSVTVSGVGGEGNGASGSGLGEQAMSLVIPLDCRVVKESFWERLSDDERALVLLSAAGLLASILGIVRNIYRFRRMRCTFDQVLWTLRVLIQDAVAEATGRIRDVARSGDWRFSNIAAVLPPRLASILLTLADRLHWEDSTSRNGGPRNQYGPLCCKCTWRSASFLCFPCGHLCLCVACAEEVTLWFIGGETNIRCPRCRADIQCVMDGKPATMFENHAPLNPSSLDVAPSLLGRSSSRFARGRRLASRAVAAATTAAMRR